MPSINTKTRLTLALIYRTLIKNIPKSFRATGPLKELLKGLSKGIWQIQQWSQPDARQPLRFSGEVLSIDEASDSSDGYLSKANFLSMRVRTVSFTVGLADRSDVNYAFTSPADTASQDVGSVQIPANARLISARIRNLVAPVGGTVSLSLGFVGDLTEYLPTVDLTTLNSFQELAGTNPPTQLVVKTLRVGGTPGANWDLLSQGKWGVVVSYIIQAY